MKQQLLHLRAKVMIQDGGWFDCKRIQSTFCVKVDYSHQVMMRLGDLREYRVEYAVIDGYKSMRITDASVKTHEYKLFRLAIFGEAMS